MVASLRRLDQESQVHTPAPRSGMNLQCRHDSLTGSQTCSLSFTGWCSVQLSYTSQGCVFYFLRHRSIHLFHFPIKHVYSLGQKPSLLFTFYLAWCLAPSSLNTTGMNDRVHGFFHLLYGGDSFRNSCHFFSRYYYHNWHLCLRKSSLFLKYIPGHLAAIPVYQTYWIWFSQMLAVYWNFICCYFIERVKGCQTMC